MNTTARTAVLALVVVLTGTALVGCTVTVSDPPAATEGATGAPQRATPAATATGVSGAATDATGAAPAPLVDDERMARLHRTTWADAVTQHLTCDGGEATVERNADAMVVEVAGECRTVTIHASGATVLLPAVGSLTIDGDASVAIVESADEIVLADEADANLVGWERGTPVVRDTGVLNVTTPIS